MRFDIEPYQGAKPIMFGMSRETVHQFLGMPKQSFPVWDGSGVTEHYEGFNVGYDLQNRVKHLGFTPGSLDLAIGGQTIWNRQRQSDPNSVLLELDPLPVEFVGFWIYLQLGVTTTGYHNDDPSQHAVAVFPQGGMDRFLEKTRAANTERYKVGRT
jgi:hypothetical protein